MTHSQRAKKLVHAILDHPRTGGNNWNAEIWGELYDVAQKALDEAFSGGRPPMPAPCAKGTCSCFVVAPI